MARLSDILRWCDQTLESHQFKDYAPNGLQVEGRQEVRSIVSGVTASEALIDAAIEREADTLLVHHGYFWRGENPNVVGMKRNRLAKLLKHDINLIGYHLPLDAHVEMGNNAQLAKVLGLSIDDRFQLADATWLGFVSRLDKPRSGSELADHVARCLERKPLYVSGTDQPVRVLAWCTGGAQDGIEEAHAFGADAYLTGEVSERTVHFAREMGMHFYAAGHHATERYGVQALGEQLAQMFGVAHEFVDIDNPV